MSEAAGKLKGAKENPERPSPRRGSGVADRGLDVLGQTSEL